MDKSIRDSKFAEMAPPKARRLQKCTGCCKLASYINSARPLPLLCTLVWLLLALGSSQAQQQPTGSGLSPSQEMAEQHNSASEQQVSASDFNQLVGALASQQQQQQQISLPASGQEPATGSGGSQARSRSARSIGEMFKKLFNGNKRSKQSSSNRDWEQQQQYQQQQQVNQLAQQAAVAQHQQQNQAANMAASLAAAAANQHAVYASPFATYSPAAAVAAQQAAAQQASALYSQFAAGPSLVAWPTTTSLAGSLRPTLIGSAAPGTAVTLTSANGSPLYAAASQSYNSYAPPPQMTSGGAGSSGPVAAASHVHPSAVAGPSQVSGGPSNQGLDFHQVLDALVRTSGFAPAGDSAEAAAASGYGPKSDATPVFSFKKLISMPFYLSTEEKSLDGLANAVVPASSGGYSLHTMPLMRRHVRRMSTPQQQQQQQGLLESQRRERAQYNQYVSALNNQLASNNQMVQYLSQQQSVPSVASQMEAISAEAALANYQALVNAAAGQPSGFPTYRASPERSGATSGLAMAASMVQPTAVQAPASMQQQQRPLARQYNEQQELNWLLQQLSAASQESQPATLNQASPFPVDGHRLGAQHWPASANQAQPAQQASSSPNPADNQPAEYANQQHSNNQAQNNNNSNNMPVGVQNQNNAMDHQQLNHLSSQQANQLQSAAGQQSASPPHQANNGNLSVGQQSASSTQQAAGQQHQQVLSSQQQMLASGNLNLSPGGEGQQQQQ